MKKVLIVAALLLCAAVPAFSSVTDTMLNVGLTGSTSELTLFRNSEFDAKFDIEAVPVLMSQSQQISRAILCSVHSMLIRLMSGTQILTFF